MEYRPLGNTGLCVSTLALGTVELGIDYGFRDSDHFRRPDPLDAIRLIRCAWDLGINLIDTAPAYGDSEKLIGKAFQELPHQAYIASKVTIPEADLNDGNWKRFCQNTIASIEASLDALQVETIDLIQIHNTSLAILQRGEVRRCFEEAQRQGKVRFVGVSCYEEDVSLEALNGSWIDTLQIPFNLLDRRMTSRVFSRAAVQGVGVLARSAFLRGVLTSQIDSIPDRLAPLKRTAVHALTELKGEVGTLSELALRYCLSFKEVSSVIIGVRSLSELEVNMANASKGGLSAEKIRRLHDISVEDQALVDIRNWGSLI